jgi:hypothetical protein
LKPAKPPKAAKRSENKTVPPKAKAAPKAKPGGAPKAGTAAKPAPKKPPVKKAPKTGPNTSAPARAGVVQSRQNKKPASRKPTSLIVATTEPGPGACAGLVILLKPDGFSMTGKSC